LHHDHQAFARLEDDGGQRRDGHILLYEGQQTFVKQVTGLFPDPCHFARVEAWISLMADSGLLTNGSTSQAAMTASRRQTIFRRLIAALHFSRQLEATRVLRRYRHLIVEDFQDQPTKRPTGLR
jgi:hypothetical protein